mgnify:CR=1 FL=1
MLVAVTGANGFVGRAVVAALVADGHRVRALTRSPDASLALPGVEAMATGAIEQIADWRPYLSGVEAVVHTAARAHVPDARFADEAVVRAVNADAAVALLDAAARRGARRFVFVSSVKVHGEASAPGRPFRPDDPFAPDDVYARSKVAAEEALTAKAAATGIGLTILRPPLVHGPGVRANMLRLVDLVAKAPVLPFGAIDNRRSLVSVGNLAAAIAAILLRAETVGRAYLVADAETLSTRALTDLIARGLGRAPVQLPVPAALFALAGRMSGRSGLVERLIGTLEVDASALATDAGWRPVETAEAALAALARWYLARPSA